MANGVDPTIKRPLLAQCGVCLMAGIGGIIPTLSRLGSTYVTNPETPPPEFGLFIGLAIFFFIGSALALAFQERQTKQAFILGVCAPGIITNIVAGVTDARRTASVETAIAALVSPAPAFAQSTGKSSTPFLRDDDGGVVWRQVAIDFAVPKEFDGGAAEEIGIPVQVVVYDRKGTTTASRAFAPGTIVKAVPPTTAGLQFRAGDADTTVALPAAFREARVRVHIVPDGYGWNDLRWALGGKRKLRVSKLTAEVERSLNERPRVHRVFAWSVFRPRARRRPGPSIAP